jgi:1-aminocyclopropane-1-carboxylate deaminase/D-cysteine desulfhydrase-like pyridoxal-dependent ACC family enzyme
MKKVFILFAALNGICQPLKSQQQTAGFSYQHILTSYPIISGITCAAAIYGCMQLYNKLVIKPQKLIPTQMPNQANPFLTFSISNKPFQEREQELQLYNYFGINAHITNEWIDTLNKKLANFHYPSNFKQSDNNALFEAYPALQTKIPYLALASLPTPLQKLESLSSESGIEIYLKNDALSGGLSNDGKYIYGGNKVRKLSYLLAEAQKLGAKKILTFGCVGSNHAVATTVHAQRAGMESVICMLAHQPPSLVVQQNLLTHLKYGSELYYSADNNIRKIATLSVWLEQYKKDGHVPYIIPTGGSNKIGVLGFVTAAFELAQQIKQNLMPMPTHIYVPVGSCGTIAGLLLGCKAAGISTQIIGIAVEPEEQPTFAEQIKKLFTETNAYLHELDNNFPIFNYTDQDLKLDLLFTGPDYGVFTKEGSEAQKLIKEKEHLTLEGTYTGKACAGLLHDLAQLPKQSVVLFWNTYCGLDFSEDLKDLDYKKLPHCFHDYFDPKNLQPLA